MKTLIICIVISTVLFSCAKNVSNSSQQGPRVSQSDNIAPSSTQSNLIYASNGHYTSSFGGGIDFGTYFPQPLSVPSYLNGTPFSASTVSGVPLNGNGLLSFSNAGAYFTCSFATFGSVNSVVTDSIASYDRAFFRYVSDTTGKVPDPNWGSYIPTVVSASGGGVIVFQGTFVYSTTSPTHVALISGAAKPVKVFE